MNALENIGNLVELLVGKVEVLIGEREKMLAEISSLRGSLMECDKASVKALQDTKIELEATRMDALRFEQERTRIEAKLKNLNDRLTAVTCYEKLE